jgi:hypothetical protein
MTPCPPRSAKGALPTPSGGSGVKGAKRRRRREPLMPLPAGGKLDKPRARRFQRVTATRAVPRRTESSAVQPRYTRCAGWRGRPQTPCSPPLRAPCSLLPAPCSLLPAPCSLLPAPCSLLPALCSPPLLSAPTDRRNTAQRALESRLDRAMAEPEPAIPPHPPNRRPREDPHVFHLPVARVRSSTAATSPVDSYPHAGRNMDFSSARPATSCPPARVAA